MAEPTVSTPEVPAQTEPVEPTTVVEQPPEPQEKTYRYQATDEFGRPIGRPTVIKYKTEDELVAGIQKAANAIQAATRTPDLKPEAKEPTIQELQAKLTRLEEIRMQERFLATHPEYYNVEANGQILTDYLRARDLPITGRNLEIAYSQLNLQGALIPRPIPESPAPANPVVRTAAPVAAGVKPGTITNRPVPPRPLTLADINAMPTEEFKRRCKDENFVALVNRLGVEAKLKRQRQA